MTCEEFITFVRSGVGRNFHWRGRGDNITALILLYFKKGHEGIHPLEYAPTLRIRPY